MNTMIENKLVRAKVDYYYTCDGVKTQSTITMAVGQDPNNPPNEDFFINYLQKRHPGCSIEIISLEWL